MRRKDKVFCDNCGKFLFQDKKVLEEANKLRAEGTRADFPIKCEKCRRKTRISKNEEVEKLRKDVLRHFYAVSGTFDDKINKIFLEFDKILKQTKREIIENEVNFLKVQLSKVREIRKKVAGLQILQYPIQERIENREKEKNGIHRK